MVTKYQLQAGQQARESRAPISIPADVITVIARLNLPAPEPLADAAIAFAVEHLLPVRRGVLR